MTPSSNPVPYAYARAVYDTALATWIRDLSALRDSLRREGAVKFSLDDASVPFEDRRALMERLLPSGASAELRNFAFTLVSEGHVSLLDDIISELQLLAEHGLNVIKAQVTTAVPPSDDERSAIERRLIERYGGNVNITWNTDAAIIGGVVIRVGDEVIDDSIATRLESLRSALKGTA
jgi:F-type H+-transporting ATPase subunit delta